MAHEIGHAIGFFHEQARFDRDKEIVVMEQNIAQGKASQFRKYKVTAMHTHDVPYDVSSLMHYGSKVRYLADYQLELWHLPPSATDK